MNNGSENKEHDGQGHAEARAEPEQAAEAPERSAEKQEPEDGNGPDSGPPDIEAALAEAERQLAERHDAMLRMQAEMDNLRKRLVRDLERSRKFALERMMADLLPVWDSLERGLEADGGTATVESMKEGKALIKKMLGKVMQDHGLSLVDPLGEAFDPEFHEAMTMLPSEEYAADTVMEVLQKGFRIHDRLLRPAMVVVSQGPGPGAQA